VTDYETSDKQTTDYCNAEFPIPDCQTADWINGELKMLFTAGVVATGHRQRLRGKEISEQVRFEAMKE